MNDRSPDWPKPLTPYWTLQLTSWFAYAGVSVLAFLPSTPLERVPHLVLIKSTRALIGLPISHLLQLVYHRLMQRQLPVALTSLVIVVVCISAGVAWMLLASITLGLLEGTAPALDWPTLPHRSIDMIMTLLGWTAAYFGWRHWHAAEVAREVAANAKQLAVSAQLDALRYQVNPHFLFNALTSIRACIGDDADRARTMITHLSMLLRHALTTNCVQHVPLSLEMDALADYFALESARFEERIAFATDVSPDARSALLPPFLLQPMVENAVIHGSRTNGVQSINICARVNDGRLQLSVANTGVLGAAIKREQGMGGIGLRNVRERLAHVYPGAHEFRLFERADHVYAELSIPYEAANAYVG